MSLLKIVEYSQLGNGANHADVPAGLEPAVNEQILTFTTTVASDAFGDTTSLVLLVPEADCHVVFGTAPVAVVATHRKLTSGQHYYYSVTPGDSIKVAAIDA